MAKRISMAREQFTSPHLARTDLVTTKAKKSHEGKNYTIPPDVIPKDFEFRGPYRVLASAVVRTSCNTGFGFALNTWPDLLKPGFAPPVHEVVAKCLEAAQVAGAVRALRWVFTGHPHLGIKMAARFLNLARPEIRRVASLTTQRAKAELAGPPLTEAGKQHLTEVMQASDTIFSKVLNWDDRRFEAHWLVQPDFGEGYYATGVREAIELCDEYVRKSDLETSNRTGVMLKNIHHVIGLLTKFRFDRKMVSVGKPAGAADSIAGSYEYNQVAALGCLGSTLHDLWELDADYVRTYLAGVFCYRK